MQDERLALRHLLAIKRLREQRAELALARDAQRLQRAHQALDSARQALAQYRDWAQAEELRRYRELCAQVVSGREIVRAIEGISALRAGDAPYVQAVTDAEVAVDEATTAVRTARERLNEAMRATRKCAELAEAADTAWQTALTLREDNDMEETASALHERERALAALAEDA